MLRVIGNWASAAKIGLVVAMLAGLGTLGLLYKNALEDNAVKEQAIEQLSSRLGELQGQINREQERYSELQQTRRDIQSQYRNVVSELQQYRGREDVVLAKPGLVEDRVQESFDGFMKEMECATGAVESCEP